jgi:bleomycin hydrolase
VYEIEFDRNLYEGINWWFINLPTQDFKNAALEAIKNNEAMYFSCDVGKELSRDKGILAMGNYDYESLFDTKFGMDKKARILTHQSGSTHGMALVGVDVDENGKITKWLLENSWGASSGHNGYLIMTDEWFDNYMFRIVIPKKYLSKKILDKLNQKRIKLPPWDPMFEYDN